MWPNPQFPTDLFTFTEEILNGKLHLLCTVSLLIRVFRILNTILEKVSGLTRKYEQCISIVI